MTDFTSLVLSCEDDSLMLIETISISGITTLFHPRRQEWDDHFAWRGIHLVGKGDWENHLISRNRRPKDHSHSIECYKFSPLALQLRQRDAKI